MFRFHHRHERGQVVMFAALLAPLLLGMTGMAIDIGGYAGHKRHLQNAADSIALAAAQDLCKVTCTDTSAATTTGNQWAVKNNINTSDATLTFSGGSTAPTVRATIQTNHSFAFMKILGVNSKGIGASAAAVKASFGGSSRHRPLVCHASDDRCRRQRHPDGHEVRRRPARTSATSARSASTVRGQHVRQTRRRTGARTSRAR